MKKILTSILIAISVLACGKKEQANEVKTEGLKGSIVVQAEEQWKPYYDAAIARVKEKNPEADIQVKVIPSFDHLEIIDKTDVTNKDVADLFGAPLDKAPILLQKEAVVPFDAKALAEKIGGFGNYDEGLGGRLKDGDKYLGFPMNIEAILLGMNVKNASAQGIDLSKDVELSTLKANVSLIPIMNAWFGVAITNAFDVELLGQDGDKFFSDLTKNWEELTPDQQKMFEGMYNYWKTSHEAKTPMFDPQAAYGYMDSQFFTGKEGSVRIIGPWDGTPLSENIKDDFDVAPLSKGLWCGKPLKHWKSGWAFFINARNEENKDKIDLCEALIAELLNPKYATDYYKITSKIMPNVSKEEYEKLDLKPLDKKIIAAVIDGFDASVSRPLFKEWGQVWDTWQNALVSWESKNPKNVQDAYKEIQASFKSLLTNIDK